MEILKHSREDIRTGADRLHDALDGKIVLPDRLAVFLAGVIGAAVPFLVLCRIGGVI